MTTIKNHKLWTIYNGWYEENKINITENGFRLNDKAFFLNPKKDRLRGLNLITYFNKEVNKKVEDLVLSKLQMFSSFAYTIPQESRHVTILDIIPHNSGVKAIQVRKQAKLFSQAIEKVLIKNPKYNIKIVFNGLLISPDGITLQGFPVNASLDRLKSDLRQEFLRAGLINMESKKYIINTAHLSLLKFFVQPDVKKLIEKVNKMRETPEIKFLLDQIVLNISCRYDKHETVEVIRKFEV